MARKAILRGKAWQSVSLLVPREATGEAAAGSPVMPSERALPRPLLPFGWVAPVMPNGVDHNALGFDLVVDGIWEAAHPSPAGGLTHRCVELGRALHSGKAGLGRPQKLVP